VVAGTERDASAIDVELLVGPSLQLRFRRVVLDLGLAVGVAAHTWEATGGSGVSYAVLAAAPISVGVRVGRLGLALRVAPGLASSAQRDLVAQTEVYARGPLRLEATLSLSLEVGRLSW
jgi:hypothetical protein